MAFLCPVRIRRGKKKKSSGDVDKDLVRAPGMGRITGSASIETLVRVGIEKENGLAPDSKMVVLHDFTPCVDDELDVKRGQVVNILYRENDWVYVIAANSRQEGFIPHSYCTPYNSHLGELALSNVKKKLPREQRSGNSSSPGGQGDGGASEADLQECRAGAGGDISDCESYGNKKTTVATTQQLNMTSSQASLHSVSSSQPDVHPFFKDPSGRYIVLYTFIARDENDVSVERGEFVTVLNREDPDWYWIVRSDGQEGFVPSGFVYPAHVIQATSRAVQDVAGLIPADCVVSHGSVTMLRNVTYDGCVSGGEDPGVSSKWSQLFRQHIQAPNCRRRADGTRGHLNQNTSQNVSSSFTSAAAAHLLTAPSNDDLRYHGTELVMLYDYKDALDKRYAEKERQERVQKEKRQSNAKLREFTRRKNVGRRQRNAAATDVERKYFSH